MKRNCLYTINPYNKNIFEDGGLASWDRLASGAFGVSYGDAGKTLSDYQNSTNVFGLSKIDNPFSKGNIAGGFGSMAKTGIGSGILSGLAGGISKGAQGLISGGLNSGAGNAIGSLGRGVGSLVGRVNPLLGAAVSVGSGIIGGGVNALVGTATDQKKLAANNEAISAWNSYASTADSTDAVKGLTAMQNYEDAYRSGLLRKGWANSRNDEARTNFANAKSFAERSITNNVDNIIGDMIANSLYNYSAFGGPLGYAPMTGALGIMQADKYINAINNRTDAIAKTQNLTSGSSFSPLGNAFAEGGGIHINPAHKGQFTSKAKRAGMGVQEYASHVLANKEDYPSSTVKQANFAKNAAGWKHDDGGALKAAFIQDFGNDPIGAAMRYNQGLEAVAAQREAAEAAAQEEQAKQQAYKDLQDRLTSVEASNIALQALVDGIGSRQTTTEGAPAAPVDIPEDIRGWDYIEKKLKGSGRFNDIQIAGIKQNINRESGFNPRAVGDNGAAVGLAQWHPDRRPQDMSLDGQIQHLIDTLSAYDGNKHWIGRDNYEGFLNARTPEEAHYYIARGYERPAASITDNLRRRSNMSLRRYNAFGGELGTNGTDFTTGLLEINAGGDHEENPFEGVQLGFDAQGIPNLVEEGETVYNDYVFSKRLQVPPFMRRQLGLGGNIKDEISFAAASKKIASAAKDRPNNPMDEAYLEDALAKLANVQEAERARMQAENTNMMLERINALPTDMYEQGLAGLSEIAACGGKINKYADGGAMEWLKQNHPNIANKEAIAKVMDKRAKVIGYKAKDQSKVYNYENVYNDMLANNAPIGRNNEKLFNSLVSDGMPKEVAFSLAYPTRLSYPYGGTNYAQELSAARDAAYNKLVRKNSQSSNNTNKGQSTGEPLPTIDWNNTGYRMPGLDNGDSGSTSISGNRSSKAATTSGATTPTNSNVGTGNRRSATNAGATRSTTRIAAPRAATVAPDSGIIAPQELVENGTWNLGNYDWLNNPQYQAGNQGIPYSRSAAENDIRNIENSDSYKAWTDYVLNNWDNPDVQNYLRELDTRAGGNHLMTDNPEEARQYFRDARNDGRWGYYHLTPGMSNTPTAAVEGSVAPAPENGPYNFEDVAKAEGIDLNNNQTPLGRVFHAMDGDAYDGYIEGEMDPNVVGAETRRETLPNGDVVIYHAGVGNGGGVSGDAGNAGVSDNNGAAIAGADGKIKPLDTWMRYAPAIGAGIMTLTDALGLTNKPDYTYANKLEAAAERLGYAPNVQYKPIGDYMRYRPFDRLFYANQLQANARATDRNLMNISGGNRATAASGMLANWYNTNNNMGNLYRQAEEYNQAQRERVADFNRRTNMFNSQMDLEANMANARYRQQAAHASLQGLAQAAALRDSIDQRIGASRSANITNLLTSLGNIGRENFAINQINDDDAFNYGITTRGTTPFKGRKTTAFGGEIEKYNKRKNQRRR